MSLWKDFSTAFKEGYSGAREYPRARALGRLFTPLMGFLMLVIGSFLIGGWPMVLFVIGAVITLRSLIVW